MKKQNNIVKSLILFIFIGTTSLFSKVHMAQIKPYESYEIKSQTSGLVTYVDKNSESKYIDKEQVLIKIDSKDEEIELLKEKNSLKLQQEIIKLKEMNYKAKHKIKQLSKYDKNNEKISFLETKKTLFLNTYNIQKLQREINKKIFKIQNRYINEIFIKEGEYVSTGGDLFSMYDISKLKITLYLSKKEIKNLENQSVFINNIKSDFKLYKISKIKDEVKVSRYKVQFVKENEDLNKFFFDDIVEIEIK